LLKAVQRRGLPVVDHGRSLLARPIRQRLEAGARPIFQQVTVRVLEVDVNLAALLDPRAYRRRGARL
jgi:hypothetical protein